MRILVTEDEPKVARALEEGLTQERYDVCVATTGEEGFHELNAQRFDLVLLDLMLPGRDGIEILQTVRERGLDTPVLILTARDAVDDRVLGLDAGADDYLVKPFAFSELLARVRALLRRDRPQDALRLKAGDLEMDVATRKVTRGGTEVELTARELQILECLLRRQGMPVSRDTLSREAWGGFEVVESMLVRGDDGSVRFAGGHHYDAYEEEQIRAEVWDPVGELLVRTAAVGSWTGALPKSSGRHRLRIDGERVRLLQGPHSVAGRPVLIRVFRSAEHMHSTLDTLSLIALLGLPLGIAIAALVGYPVARQSLAPVARITDKAKVITADRLDERLAVDNPHDEIGRLATVFNDTFRRLGASFEQLRRFTADASHELRTPLTSLRSVEEVALGRSRSAEAYRDVIGSMLEEVERLTRLLDSLLTLSRADAGRIPLDRKAEDLVAMVEDIAAHMAPLAEERGQRIEVSGESGAAHVDLEVLRLSIVNVLDNAIQYGPEGGPIDVTVSAASDPLTIAVHDEGPGVPKEHREHIFERFYRADKARSRATGGSGLGLSIAQWAVEAHSGSLVLVDRDGATGATFRIQTPRSDGGSS